MALKGVPYIVTHDGRTIRYPDPLVKVNDTVMVDIATGKIKDFIKFDSGIITLIKISREVRRIKCFVYFVMNRAFNPCLYVNILMFLYE